MKRVLAGLQVTLPDSACDFATAGGAFGSGDEKGNADHFV